jgi:arylsulfatase A-like enzyme
VTESRKNPHINERNLPEGLTRRDVLSNGLYSCLGGALSSCLWVSGCGKRGRKSRPNVLLISIDTLRADHLGCYGYKRDTSRNIDDFAAESIRFDKVYAPTPWTLPSHAAMLTGIHPFSLGMDNRWSIIPPDCPSLASLLKNAGYQTIAFVDSMPKGFLGAERGFDRGFESFNHAPYLPRFKYKYDMAVTVDVASQWLEKRDKKSPFFIFLHTKSVHGCPPVKGGDPRGFPYDKPEPYRCRYLTAEQARLNWRPPFVVCLRNYNELIVQGKMDPRKYPRLRIEALKGQYDAGIYYTDEHFGRLITLLGDMRLLDDMVVIFTADHGEAFLEHRFFIHKEVYKELLHVPLIVHLPGQHNGSIIRSPAALRDIVPTILRLASIDVPEEVSGIELPMNPATKRARRQFYAYYQFGSEVFKDEFSLQQDDWKFVYYQTTDNKWHSELYNITKDPEEKNPIVKQAERKKALCQELLSWIASKSSFGNKRINLDVETMQHLKSLGYVD